MGSLNLGWAFVKNDRLDHRMGHIKIALNNSKSALRKEYGGSLALKLAQKDEQGHTVIASHHTKVRCITERPEL